MGALPKWVANKPIILDVEDITTSTMTRNNKKYNYLKFRKFLQIFLSSRLH